MRTKFYEKLCEGYRFFRHKGRGGDGEIGTGQKPKRTLRPQSYEVSQNFKLKQPRRLKTIKLQTDMPLIPLSMRTTVIESKRSESHLS